MQGKSYHAIETLLTSAKPEEVLRGLELAQEEMSKGDLDQVEQLYEMVSALFYIDQLDRPDLVPALEKAIDLVASLGTKVIPLLTRHLEAGDFKAQMAIAQALGRMGADAIDPLMEEYRSEVDPACHAFCLYALGHVSSPEVVKAAPIALEAAESPDQELRDTATRAIGKFAEAIPPERLPEDLRAGFVEKLKANLADRNPGIRAKAVRSLGKLAKYGHLTADERVWLKATLAHLLGEDEYYEWDRAYIVRREAKEAQEYV